jgi:hypothetical protein
MTVYRVWYGNDGYTADDTYESSEEALAAIGAHMGWSDPVEGESYTVSEGEGYAVCVSVYESDEACEAEERGSHAPTITEVQS